MGIICSLYEEDLSRPDRMYVPPARHRPQQQQVVYQQQSVYQQQPMNNQQIIVQQQQVVYQQPVYQQRPVQQQYFVGNVLVGEGKYWMQGTGTRCFTRNGRTIRQKTWRTGSGRNKRRCFGKEY